MTGFIGYTARDLKDLFAAANLTGFILPNFQWNVLNYGRIRNNIRTQDAQFQGAALRYQQAVLTAGREVEDALVAFLQAQQQAVSLETSVTEAALSVDLVLEQFKAGATDFNRVYTTQSALVSQQDSLAQARQHRGQLGSRLPCDGRRLAVFLWSTLAGRRVRRRSCWRGRRCGRRDSQARRGPARSLGPYDGRRQFAASAPGAAISPSNRCLPSKNRSCGLGRKQRLERGRYDAIGADNPHPFCTGDRFELALLCTARRFGSTKQSPRSTADLFNLRRSLPCASSWLASYSCSCPHWR